MFENRKEDLSRVDGGDSVGGVGSYVSMLEDLPTENAIVRRFVVAAHMLTRAALANAMFSLARSFNFTWEESVEIVGDTLSLSRSSVAREMRDMERLVAVWNESGFSLVGVEEAVARFTKQVRARLEPGLFEVGGDGK